MKYQIILIFLVLSNLGFTQNKIKKNSCPIFVSNVLTRNDGDKLIINTDCKLLDFNFKMYNKWGEIMYESNHFQSPMDFDLHEKIVENGEEKYKFPKMDTFIWIMTYRLSMEKPEDALITKSGSIKIL